MSFPPRRLFRSFWFFLILLGPGIITAFADNDAGGITTYSVAGAHFGYKFLWILILITFVLAMIQEMAARLGAFTGKGLSDLIREEFGLGWTLLAMSTLLIANLATIVSNFAGIAASFELFNITRVVSLPLMAFLIWILVVQGSYHSVERIFLAICLLGFSYIFSGFLARPDWGLALHRTFIPSVQFSFNYFSLFLAIVGTTITPWMQFYLQSSVVEKGLSPQNYKYTRLEVLLGAFFTDFISFFIIVACASTLFIQGVHIETAADAAWALAPLAGLASQFLFALGLLGASTLASFILPLSTAYAFCEAFGFENGLNKKFSEAPVFYSFYTGLIVLGALVVLFPRLPLVPVMLTAQVIQGVLLPIILIFMLKLINNRKLMGRHVNTPVYNAAVWALVLVLIAASASLVVLPFFG